MIEIRKLTAETVDLLFTVEDRRLDSERVFVRPKQNSFALEYRALPGALWRVGNAQQYIQHDTAAWLDGTKKTIYLAWLDEELAGQILIEAAGHNLARIRDIRVALQLRRHGVGDAMVTLAEDWARGKGLLGLLAETQDVNAGACQFFSRCGFELGGIDMLRYVAHSPQTMKAVGLRESALFFYKFLR